MIYLFLSSPLQIYLSYPLIANLPPSQYRIIVSLPSPKDANHIANTLSLLNLRSTLIRPAFLYLWIASIIRLRLNMMSNSRPHTVIIGNVTHVSLHQFLSIVSLNPANIVILDDGLLTFQQLYSLKPKDVIDYNIKSIAPSSGGLLSNPILFLKSIIFRHLHQTVWCDRSRFHFSTIFFDFLKDRIHATTAPDIRLHPLPACCVELQNRQTSIFSTETPSIVLLGSAIMTDGWISSQSLDKLFRQMLSKAQETTPSTLLYIPHRRESMEEIQVAISAGFDVPPPIDLPIELFLQSLPPDLQSNITVISYGSSAMFTLHLLQKQGITSLKSLGLFLPPRLDLCSTEAHNWLDTLTKLDHIITN